MTNRDLVPSRYEVVMQGATRFISRFFEANPLSQLQLVVTSDGIAKALTPLSGMHLEPVTLLQFADLPGNPAQHLRALAQKGAIPCEGDISIKNSLKFAVASLKYL